MRGIGKYGLWSDWQEKFTFLIEFNELKEKSFSVMMWKVPLRENWGERENNFNQKFLNVL